MQYHRLRNNNYYNDRKIKRRYVSILFKTALTERLIRISFCHSIRNHACISREKLDFYLLESRYFSEKDPRMVRYDLLLTNTTRRFMCRFSWWLFFTCICTICILLYVYNTLNIVCLHTHADYLILNVFLSLQTCYI